MRRIAVFLFEVAMVVFAIGCTSQMRSHYVDPGEIVTGASEQATMYDLESSAQILMERMFVHPQFMANYKAARAANGGKIPIAVIGNIENKTTERIQGRLDAVGDTVRSALFSSGQFEVKDDEAANAILSRILRSADSGMEDGVLVQAMGDHESPDFIMLGDFRHFSDVGGYHTYRLRLALHNLKTGKIVWEGIQTKVKL